MFDGRDSNVTLDSSMTAFDEFNFLFGCVEKKITKSLCFAILVVKMVFLMVNMIVVGSPRCTTIS